MWEFFSSPLNNNNNNNDDKSTTTTQIDNYLGLVSDEVHFRFGWLCGCGRRDVDLGRLVRFLDQHIDERLLFGWWRDCRYVWHGGRWWCGCLDEHDLVVLLWWWWRLHRLLRGVVSGLWGWNVHVHVLVYDGRLLRWPVLWWWPAARVRATVTSATDRSCVAVQSEPRKSATACAETGQRRFWSAQASAHCQQHLWKTYHTNYYHIVWVILERHDAK